jgi:hypothetical protein
MDWFERLTGFRESGIDAVRRHLRVDGDRLESIVNGASYCIGRLELASLADLRDRVALRDQPLPGPLKVSVVSGDARKMHRDPEYRDALFQVASQFNLLEMTSPAVSPEDGVTRYAHDPTQGPACAIAAGAATIFRNYFVPTEAGLGQTRESQLDALRDVGLELSAATGRPVDQLWQMRNGYALCSRDGMDQISRHLDAADEDQIDAMRGKLRIGLHWDIDVTDGTAMPRPRVSQAFCSALPISYSSLAFTDGRAFATLVLEAAYEATLLAAVVNAQRGVSNRVLLTLVGAGAFGNDRQWILAAIRRALRLPVVKGLDVRIVSFGWPPDDLLAVGKEFA